MATTPRPSSDPAPARRAGAAAAAGVDYPTSDGRPMGETDLHRQGIMDLIEALEDRYKGDPDVYVSGDLLLFYERGNRRKHLAPDVFVAFGVPKRPPRDHYLVWNEGKGPDVVIELTSKTTRREDQTKNQTLHRDVLKVPEYFLFDPTEDYLEPPLQGFRLVEDRYEPIGREGGRLPSELLGLHLERNGPELRLHDPLTGRWLPTRKEALARSRALAAESNRLAAESTRQAAESARREAEAAAENDRLRREVDELRRRLGGRAPEEGGVR